MHKTEYLVTEILSAFYDGGSEQYHNCHVIPI